MDWFLSKKRAARESRTFLLTYIGIGPCPIQLVVPSAVRKAVSAATSTFTAISVMLFLFIR